MDTGDIFFGIFILLLILVSGSVGFCVGVDCHTHNPNRCRECLRMVLTSDRAALERKLLCEEQKSANSRLSYMGVTNTAFIAK